MKHKTLSQICSVGILLAAILVTWWAFMPNKITAADSIMGGEDAKKVCCGKKVKTCDEECAHSEDWRCQRPKVILESTEADCSETCGGDSGCGDGGNDCGGCNITQSGACVGS